MSLRDLLFNIRPSIAERPTVAKRGELLAATIVMVLAGLFLVEDMLHKSAPVHAPWFEHWGAYFVLLTWPIVVFGTRELVKRNRRVLWNFLVIFGLLDVGSIYFLISRLIRLA